MVKRSKRSPATDKEDRRSRRETTMKTKLRTGEETRGGNGLSESRVPSPGRVGDDIDRAEGPYTRVS